MMDFRDNMQKCQEYIQALKEERQKIQVFQRELPLCLDLVTQAIEACNQQLSGRTTSECSEQTTSNEPVLEDFMPLKRSNSADYEEELESNKPQINKPQNYDNNNNKNNDDKSGKKSDWLRSVQLWNQSPDPPTTPTSQKVKNNGGAFQPFEKEKSSSGNKFTSVKEEKGGDSQRKSRRSWSTELHRKFIHALQQLGGSHVATPKQIRELMKVDGLTNDEVKSHLQKYRLHTKRPTPTIINNNANPLTPQFIVVGGIWVPPPEYASVAAPAPGDTTNLATPAPPLRPQASKAVTLRQLQNCGERGSHSDGGVHSNSPATSSLDVY